MVEKSRGLETTNREPFVITISRQRGSGGAYIGVRLATRLDISCFDREIIQEAAQRLDMSESTIVSRDEIVTTLWRSLLTASANKSGQPYVPPPLNMPTDNVLYQTEADIMLEIAKQTSAVIVGRGGSHVLRGHPRHMSVFLHADIAFRKQRIRQMYNLSEERALGIIHSSDESRASYLHMITGKDWENARQYHICLDTGVLGLGRVEDIIVAAAHERFGV